MDLSPREVSDINDLLRAEAAAIEKTAFMARQCQNQDLRRIIDSHRQQHEFHYNRLLSRLQGRRGPGAPAYQPGAPGYPGPGRMYS